MRYLTAEQALFIHYRVIEETGSAHAVRDTALLESAVNRPSSTFDGKDLYADIHGKASALMHSMIRNHPFLDGNKRTAITAASIFLIMNGYAIIASNKELERFTLKAATGGLDMEDMAWWFKKKSEKRRD